MKYKFTKLHIHHFLSFDDATIDLNDRGYCLINGINNNPKDAARSNGSGKSTIANALCFALIGETISGLTNNLGNIYFDDGCYVELEFFVDNKKYNLLRSKNDDTYGTNLKIYIDDKEESGKGIRESEAVLAQLLPDLTRELIGSVVLLGQGLPDRFTANTSSKRKEVLEHLSKSDFMIQDLKRRIEERSIELSSKNRVQDDLFIKVSSEKSVYQKNIFDLNELLDKESQATDFDSKINIKKGLLEELTKKYKDNEKVLNDLSVKEKDLNKLLLEQTTLKSERLSKIYSQYVEYNNELSKSKWDFETQIKSLEQEIKSLKEIRDVCPTCGQKIPNVIKPDTRQREADLECLKNSLNNTLEEIKQNNSDYNSAKSDIENKFNESTSSTRSQLSDIERDKVLHNNNSTNLEINRLNGEIISLEKDRDSHEQKLKDYRDKITELTNKISDIEKIEKEIESKKKEISDHLDVIAKMNTYVKRDFRGILLSNSINYINIKAKEYSSKIFNTDEVEFKLDGNNIDISFCGKEYENLSGGEKQRIDLITQFAIRDMMSKHLGFSSNILFLDEITDNLDKDSCDRVINFITNEFNDIESIFIISHHSDLDIPYDSQITVVKDNMGVSNIQ